MSAIAEVMTQDVRLEQLTQWVNSIPGWEEAIIYPASADASFRRYFRASLPHHSAIVMDAPPEKESLTSFLDITERLQASGVHVPQILARNQLDGFLLLEDLGHTHYLDELHPMSVGHLYADALQSLLHLQQADCHHLPVYDDDRLRTELELMPEWFLKTHLGLAEHEIPYQLINETFDHLISDALGQPVCFVHRDYHSRNLMLMQEHNPGIIDYQDAVLGPITYDLVSLLRDCYVCWPQSQVEQWALAFRREAIANGNMPPVDERSFLRWFDLMGMQRHLKVLGIFSRLHHRDGKTEYLNDLPTVLSYIMTIGVRHYETSNLVEWMREAGIPQRIGVINIPV